MEKITQNGNIINFEEWNPMDGWTKAMVLLDYKKIHLESGNIEEVISSISDYLAEKHGLDYEQARWMLEGFYVDYENVNQI